MINKQEEGEHNKEEHNKKQENSSQELQNTNADEKIKSILPDIENSFNSFNKELKDVGNNEGIQKTWDLLDKQKKNAISEKIKKYGEDRIKAINLQKEGLKLLNPFEVGFGAWIHSEDNDLDYNEGMRDGKSLVLRPLGYLSGIFPTAGLIIEGVGSLKRVYNAIKLKSEKNRLSALESK